MMFSCGDNLIRIKCKVMMMVMMMTMMMMVVVVMMISMWRQNALSHS